MSKPDEIAKLLLRQHETAWRLAAYHLEGLSTDECLWRPGPKGLHVIFDDDMAWRGEWPEHEGYDLGPPSIAWLLWHMTYWWSMVVDHSFGDASLDRHRISCPPDAEAMAAELTSRHRDWVHRISDLDDRELLAPERTCWPFQDRPFADVVGWVNVELVKNAAEIGYARFMYAASPSD